MWVLVTGLLTTTGACATSAQAVTPRPGVESNWRVPGPCSPAVGEKDRLPTPVRVARRLPSLWLVRL